MFSPTRPIGGSRSTTSWPSERSSSAVSSVARRQSGCSRAVLPAGMRSDSAIRSGRGSVCAAATNGLPVTTSYRSAASSTPRVRKPYTDRPPKTSSAGAVGTSPRVVFSPNRAQDAAGARIDPAPSDAVDAGTSAAATAAAAPPLEPPGVRCRSHGLRVMPPARVSVKHWAASSGVRVMPTTIAPAARSRAMKAASSGSGSP